MHTSDLSLVLTLVRYKFITFYITLHVSVNTYSPAVLNEIFAIFNCIYVTLVYSKLHRVPK